MYDTFWPEMVKQMYNNDQRHSEGSRVSRARDTSESSRRWQVEGQRLSIMVPGPGKGTGLGSKTVHDHPGPCGPVWLFTFREPLFSPLVSSFLGAASAALRVKLPAEGEVHTMR